jgi:hypothetical protein
MQLIFIESLESNSQEDHFGTFLDCQLRRIRAALAVKYPQFSSSAIPHYVSSPFPLPRKLPLPAFHLSLFPNSPFRLFYFSRFRLTYTYRYG